VYSRKFGGTTLTQRITCLAEKELTNNIHSARISQGCADSKQETATLAGNFWARVSSACIINNYTTCLVIVLDFGFGGCVQCREVRKKRWTSNRRPLIFEVLGDRLPHRDSLTTDSDKN